MAHLSRLIWFALGVMLAAVPMLAFAQAGYTVSGISSSGSWAYSECATQARDEQSHLVGFWAPTLAELKTRVQSAYVAPWTCARNGAVVTFSRWVNSDGLGISAEMKMGGSFPQVRISMVATSAVCETGERDPVTGKCFECPPDRVWNGTTCESPCLEAGSSSGSLHVYEGGNLCLQSCERKATKCALKINIEGPQEGGYVCDYVFTGSSCDWIGEKFSDAPPGPEPQPEPEPEPCGSGKVSGTFNGQTICLDAGENTLRDDTKKETTETTKDDGTKEVKETTTDTRSQFDPKTGKTKTTITETTTITTVDANGNTTGTNTEIVIRKRESSGNNVDRDAGGGDGDGGEGEGGGTFAGACGIAPLCEGDAVQCAIAAAVFETQCALAYEQQALNDQWTAIETYDGTEEGGALEKKDISEGLSEMLNTSKQGPGSGLTDKAFTVFGKTVVLPFSLINQYLNVFYWAMQIIAWLVAVKILRGAVQ